MLKLLDLTEGVCWLQASLRCGVNGVLEASKSAYSPLCSMIDKCTARIQCDTVLVYYDSRLPNV